MAFIKLNDVVINTAYIAAVRLGEQTDAGEEAVTLLLAIPACPWCHHADGPSPSASLYRYEWMEFTGQAAIALRDYFSSFNTVTDLTPQSQGSPVNHRQRTKYS